MDKIVNQYPPYKKGYFKVTDGHELYFELYGNPQGIPVVFFHGGPGSGIEEKAKRFFDPNIYNVLLFEQRGAGRSRPFASLKANTTDKIIQDTKKLMKQVGFKNALLFGGSWGSTLALVFAIQNPNLVLGLIVRGVFLANKRDMHYYTQGGAKRHFPEVWERFESHVPLKHRANIASYYLQQMQSKDPKIREKYTFEWAFYECSILKLYANEKAILKELKGFSYQSLSPLEAHYMVNNCFIEENFILNNAGKLSKFPVTIIHGRYDVICPPENAHDLHKKIKGSSLFFTTAGHANSDRANQTKIIQELKIMAKKLKESHR